MTKVDPRWAVKIMEWRRLYPPPRRPRSPSDFPLTCNKCRKKRKLQRHHKGHDFLFALVLESVYAARYVQFLPEDIAWLCSRCHKSIHFIYEERGLVEKFYAMMQVLIGRAEIIPLPVNGITTVTAEKIRQDFIECCNTWLTKKVRKRAARPTGN